MRERIVVINPNSTEACTQSIDAALEALRAAAVVSDTTANLAKIGLALLARTPAQTPDGVLWFARKVAGGMAFEDDLRSLVNRRRYVGASS